MKNKIAFLFGAGVSKPAEISQTSEITKVILEGKHIYRGSAENYLIEPTNKNNWSIYAEAPQRVQEFLKVINTELSEHYKEKTRLINYEDLYNLLDFIIRNHRNNSGNPSLKYLLKEIEPRIKKLLTPFKNIPDNNFELTELLKETNIYIKDLVTIILSQKAKSFRGLAFLKNFITDNSFLPINLFTLNHDTVIEQFFESEQIIFNDGFLKKDDDYSFWNPDLLDNNEKINLYKIHGSVNWHEFDEESWTDRRICKVSQKMYWLKPRKSILLIGTDNKLSAYIRGVFLELFYRFYKSLNKSDILIIVGYSFGDKGINDQIFDWLLTGNNRMIIIDPYVENLEEKMSPGLYSEWDKRNKIVPIKEYIENITLEHLGQYL